MIGLDRVPPAVGQGLAVAGLAACFLGVALPHLRAASGAGARAELAESEAYLETRVAEFARVNQLSPNHSLEVRDYRAQLTEDLDLPQLRRAAAAQAGSDRRTPLAPLLVFAGLAILAIGCTIMLASARTGQVIWAGLLALAMVAGGVGLAHPDGGDVPGTGPEPEESKQPEAPTTDTGSDLRLCEHVIEIVFTGDQKDLGRNMRDDFIKQCTESLAKKPPTREQRRCIMNARTSDDLQACNLK